MVYIQKTAVFRVPYRLQGEGCPFLYLKESCPQAAEKTVCGVQEWATKIKDKFPNPLFREQAGNFIFGLRA